MRLLSCHIENFGTLTDCSLDFSDSIHIICEENGWGKSTFAAFIRAMFYGLEGERKKSIEENERKHYKPWQGGVFGGWLAFEVQGKRYRATRIFYDKESQDTFELRDADTNGLSDDYTRELGKELFKINRDSFLRTIFIGQNCCETSANMDINAKIGALTDNSDDLNSYETADAHLAAVINQLTPSRITGSLSKRRDQIARLERIVQDGSHISDSIETYDQYLQMESDNYERLRHQIKEAGELQTAATKRQMALAKKEQWNRLKHMTAVRLRQCREAKEAFPGELPSMNEIELQMGSCVSMDRAAERASLCKLTPEERKELSDLRTAFPSSIPSSSAIDEMTRSAVRLRTLRQQYADNHLTPEEMAAFKRFQQSFLHDTEDISAVTARWNLRNTTKAALPSKQAALTALQASVSSGQKNLSFPILGSLGIVSAAVGIALFAVSHILPGSAAMAMGVIFFIAGLLTRKKKPSPSDLAVLAQLEALQTAVEDDMAFIERTDEDVAAYLRNHGRNFDESSVSSTLHILTEESIRYSDLEKKYETSKTSVLPDQIRELRSRLFRFLETFGVSSSENRFEEDLYRLKEQTGRLVFLCRKESDFKKACSAYTAVSSEIRCFLESYGLSQTENPRAQLNSLRDHLDDYQDSQNLYEEALAELNSFEAGMDKRLLEELSSERGISDAGLPSLEELNQKILDLTNRMEACHRIMGDYNKTLEHLQEQYDEWKQNQEDLAELKALQTEEEKKYYHVLRTRDYLSQAKESLTSKYAAPILQSFCRYYECITHHSADSFHMDANTEVTVDLLGLQRRVNTLSCGYRDLIGICLRAALVDAMYQEESPVLIMDDPFINLDDQKLPAAQEFLTELSKRYQIIYLTCSSLRTFSS